MKVTLIFVPPGGGEADYQLPFEMAELPRPGDYIMIKRSDRVGSEDFIVRRTWWRLESPATGVGYSGNIPEGKVAEIMVECEFAIGPYSTEDHKNAARRYGGLEFEASAY